MRPISELFKHRGHIFVYCPSKALKAMFARDLDAQGFTFGDGVRVTEHAGNFGDIMAIHRDFTVGFCGFACHVQFGSKENPVFVKEDHSCNCTRVDYARFVSGEEAYVIRGPEDCIEVEAGQKLAPGSYMVWI